MIHVSQGIPVSVSNLLKMITRAFYSDLHIEVVDVILRMGYTSEYTISKELEMKVEKVRLVTNSLYNENFIKFEDRIFKKQTQGYQKEKRGLTRKIYKIRFWFIDSNFFIWSLKERIKRIFSHQKQLTFQKKEIVFRCPRKICGKLFSMNEIAGIPFDHRTGILTCDNFLNQKVICGTELIENKDFHTNGGDDANLKKKKNRRNKANNRSFTFFNSIS